MGRKQTQEERVDHSKARKQQKIQKAAGTFKKLNNKSNKPPDLSKFKQKNIQGLLNKTAHNHQTLAQKLINEDRKMKMDDFLQQRQQKIIQDIDEDNNQGLVVKGNISMHDSHKYMSQMKKVIESCDIILQILDARDPLSCRCKEVQRKIMSEPDKKLILVLNKIDLVPLQNAYAWQNYLRREFPVVLFKANLQNQNSNLSSVTLFKKSIAQSTQMAQTVVNSSKAIGPDHLLQLIKQLSKVQGNSRAVTVGLIGYPNVGKSSVINSLKRSKTCDVSSTPGSTKILQQIKLDKQVKLLDCPGVIFSKQLTKNQLILQNTYRANEDLEQVIEAILQRLPMKDLTQVYNIQPYNSSTDFLAKICRAYGKLGKGGIPQMKQGAKIVVEDWNRGKLKYFTIPPQLQNENQMMLE